MVPRGTAGRRPPACRDVLPPTCNRPAELAVTLAGLAAQAEPAFAVVISDQSTGSRSCEVWLAPQPSLCRRDMLHAAGGLAFRDGSPSFRPVGGVFLENRFCSRPERFNQGVDHGR